jgi:hypothetical protein
LAVLPARGPFQEYTPLYGEPNAPANHRLKPTARGVIILARRG